jgi:hypothetical protein
MITNKDIKEQELKLLEAEMQKLNPRLIASAAYRSLSDEAKLVPLMLHKKARHWDDTPSGVAT